MDQVDDQPTLSTNEAAQVLGVSPMTVLRLWRDGYLEGYKLNPST